MIFLPCNAIFSIDNLINKRKFIKVPKWNIDVLKLLITIVYLYAGLAKINSDWLFEAMPLKIWLQTKYDLPLIGNNLLQMKWVHYAMSWGGMLYDLSIPFLLMIKRTRVIAFLLVIFFHVFTHKMRRSECHSFVCHSNLDIFSDLTTSTLSSRGCVHP